MNGIASWGSAQLTASAEIYPARVCCKGAPLRGDTEIDDERGCFMGELWYAELCRGYFLARARL